MKATEAPPSRYRVIERDRRLVVIDTEGAGPVGTVPHPTASAERWLLAPEAAGFDGRATLTTHPLYDDRGPRTLTLDPGGAQLVSIARTALIGAAVAFAALAVFFPWLLVLPFALLNPRTRAPVRARVTQWLDLYDTGSSAG